MKKKIQIDIANPCSANWSAMTVTEKGRFCADCSKQVVDFTGKSDLEIIQLLNENKDERMCINASPSQLKRTIVPTPSIFSLRAVLVGASLSAMLGLEGCATSHIFHKAEKQPVENMRGDIAMTYDHSDENLVTGIVTDEEIGEIIPSVQISLQDVKGVELGKTVSNLDGSFRLVLNWDKKPEYILFHSYGFKDRIIYLNQEELLQEMKIKMVYNEELPTVGQVIVKPVE